MNNNRSEIKLYNTCKYLLIYKNTEYYISNNYNVKVLFNKIDNCALCLKNNQKYFNQCANCNFVSCTKCKYDIYIKDYFKLNKVLCPWCSGYFVKEGNLNITDKIKLILQDLYLCLQISQITSIEFAECEHDLQLQLSKNKLISKTDYLALRYSIIN